MFFWYNEILKIMSWYQINLFDLIIFITDTLKLKIKY